MPFPEPQRTEIDGVPIWFTDVPGPCQGGLIFRVGRTDETLVTSGINHIIEHLALAPLVAGRLDMNGMTAPLTTSFVVAGEQVSVEAFLMQVCQNLSALPYDRLDLERRVLQTEAMQRGQGIGVPPSVLFGAKSLGVADWMEMGIEHLTADRIEAWRRDRFTRPNAVVWMTRPPSPALWLPLEDGERHPLPTIEPLPDLALPSHTHVDAPFIGCSMVAGRSMPLFVAIEIVRERLLRHLRVERGLTYSIGFTEQRLGLQESLLSLACDTAEDRTAEAIGVFVDTIDAVADGELTEEEVLLECDALMPWKATDPSRPAADALRKAVGDLIGHTPTTWAELADEAAGLRPSQVADALREALARSILGVPAGAEVPSRYAGHPSQPRERSVLGRLFVRWDGNAMDQVVFGTLGVSRSWAGVMSSVVFFDECELAGFAPNGTAWLVDDRGEAVVLELNQLKDGRELATAIRGRIPDKVVDIRGDALGWFELQSMAEEHDSISVRAMWRELEVLAQSRRIGERVLLLALADHGGGGRRGSKRGILAVTDRRVLHLAHERGMPLVIEIDRPNIWRVASDVSILGIGLEITSRDGNELRFDRIRPRASVADLEVMLAPVDPPPDPPGEDRPPWPERSSEPARPSGPTRTAGPIP